MGKFFSPYNLSGTQLPNRVDMASMTRTRALDHSAIVQNKPEFIGHNNLLGTFSLNHESLTRSLKQIQGTDADGSEIVLPTKVVESELDIDLGKRKLHLQVWPKFHTNTDLTVLDTIL